MCTFFALFCKTRPTHKLIDKVTNATLDINIIVRKLRLLLLFFLLVQELLAVYINVLATLLFTSIVGASDDKQI